MPEALDVQALIQLATSLQHFEEEGPADRVGHHHHGQADVRAQRDQHYLNPSPDSFVSRFPATGHDRIDDVDWRPPAVRRPDDRTGSRSRRDFSAAIYSEIVFFSGRKK